MVCIDCKFYVPFRTGNDKGECRRYPPDNNNEFPVVKDKDWCGEFDIATMHGHKSAVKELTKGVKNIWDKI